MKKIFIVCSIALLLCGCGNSKEVKNYDNSFKAGYSSNILTENDQKELRKIFKDNNLSNVDLFFDLVNDFNKEEDMGCGLKDWNKTDSFKYDEFKCTDRYEKNHDTSDGDCRITAFSLIQDKIKIKPLDKDYGSYLMFDIDVLENNKDYKTINNKKTEFINLFNEIDVTKVKDEELKNVYPEKLKKYGFEITKGKVSLITVVMHDNDFNLLFVGHAGILIDLGDKYLFVEKIAFEQPYQITVLKSKEDLKSLFEKRPTYFGNGTEKGPFIYENDKLLYEFK